MKRSYIRRKSKSHAERRRIETERRNTFERDNWQCVDCGKRVMWGGEWWERGHAAHVVNASQGGEFVMENLLTKCSDCHLVKEHNPKPCPKKPSLSEIQSLTTRSEDGVTGS